MQYEQARGFVSSLTSRGISPGLSNIGRLCAALGDPQERLRVIHIAGTNGKGSVGAFLESILMCDGQSVGRFSSPAVGDCLEMFTINGVPVGEDDYAECVSRIAAAVRGLETEGVYITAFEAETAAAFLLFEKLSPDCVIIECGMGGRLDSTNIIKRPVLSVITAVSLDHTAFLGDTIYEIAREKAGIIKRGAPVVTMMQGAYEVIKAAAETLGSPVYTAEEPENVRYSENSTIFDLFDSKELSISLLGTYQPKNAALAVKAAEVLGTHKRAVRDGLSHARWKYRFMRIGKFILDGAHNPAAAAELASSAPIYMTGRCALICGVFRDKDYGRMAEITAQLCGSVYTVTPPGERGLPAVDLAAEFAKHGASACPCGSLDEAIRSAGEYDNVLIFGSLSILAEAERIIAGTHNCAGDT